MATLHAPAPAVLAARIAAAAARLDLTVPPFTAGVTNETPAYKALNAEGEVRERLGRRGGGKTEGGAVQSGRLRVGADASLPWAAPTCQRSASDRALECQLDWDDGGAVGRV